MSPYKEIMTTPSRSLPRASSPGPGPCGMPSVWLPVPGFRPASTDRGAWCWCPRNTSRKICSSTAPRTSAAGASSRWSRPSPLPRELQTIMRTLDTNVVVRVLIGDDPQQTPIAKRAFLAAIASGSAACPANAKIRSGPQLQHRWNLRLPSSVC